MRLISWVAAGCAMRFEADLQERLRRLCFHLGIEFETFPPTDAPINPTHYDLTEVEGSFKSVLDLQDGRKQIGPRQLALLKRHMDTNYFCEVTEDDGSTAVKAPSDEAENPSG